MIGEMKQELRGKFAAWWEAWSMGNLPLTLSSEELEPYRKIAAAAFSQGIEDVESRANEEADSAYKQGKNDGYGEGRADGYVEGEKEGQEAAYQSGYDDGVAEEREKRLA
jgi:flagellar biosynthesis/type III secretory pathway protein FliH